MALKMVLLQVAGLIWPKYAGTFYKSTPLMNKFWAVLMLLTSSLVKKELHFAPFYILDTN